MKSRLIALIQQERKKTPEGISSPKPQHQTWHTCGKPAAAGAQAEASAALLSETMAVTQELQRQPDLEPSPLTAGEQLQQSKYNFTTSPTGEELGLQMGVLGA